MTLEGKTAQDCDDALQREAGRRAVCVALGIDPATVPWPTGNGEQKRSEVEPPTNSEQVRLSDTEWKLVAPFLPAEAPQAKTMSTRDFLEAVLAAMRRGGAWVSRSTPAAEVEAVRRRFGRWAHQGVFQGLAEALPSLALSPESKRLLALAGERAARLRSRAAR